ncbi:MAG: hypothetical protein U0Q10_04160 [Dermatophilaceae bacterium]
MPDRLARMPRPRPRAAVALLATLALVVTALVAGAGSATSLTAPGGATQRGPVVASYVAERLIAAPSSPGVAAWDWPTTRSAMS